MLGENPKIVFALGLIITLLGVRILNIFVWGCDFWIVWVHIWHFCQILDVEHDRIIHSHENHFLGRKMAFSQFWYLSKENSRVEWVKSAD